MLLSSLILKEKYFIMFNTQKQPYGNVRNSPEKPFYLSTFEFSILHSSVPGTTYKKGDMP